MTQRKQIATFADWFGDRVTLDLHAYANPSMTGDRTLPTGKVHGRVKAIAEVNHGRWIARCPFCVVGAELASPGGLFFCCNCRNADVDHDVIPTVFPPEKDRRAAEKILLEREDDRTRNWDPASETAADLRLENAKHKR